MAVEYVLSNIYKLPNYANKIKEEFMQNFLKIILTIDNFFDTINKSRKLAVAKATKLFRGDKKIYSVYLMTKIF